jgi:hypothetical protein
MARPRRSRARASGRFSNREIVGCEDAAYPAHTAIKLILDNHSAHISKETRAWLAAPPAHRFEFTFTPKHGSWLNLVRASFQARPRSTQRWTV